MRIGIVSFEQAEADIRGVRDAVFGVEQHVPRELDWDGRDPECVHAIATDVAGRVVGTGRLQPDGRIGRLAVLSSCRGRGVGGLILEALVEAARERGLECAFLHAQAHAIPFYLEHGFAPEGDSFLEAGIEHVSMTRPLRA